MKVDLTAHQIRGLIILAAGGQAGIDHLQAIQEARAALGDALDRDRRNPMLTADEMDALLDAGRAVVEFVDQLHPMTAVDLRRRAENRIPVLKEAIRKLGALHVRQLERESTVTNGKGRG